VDLTSLRLEAGLLRIAPATKAANRQVLWF